MARNEAGSVRLLKQSIDVIALIKETINLFGGQVETELPDEPIMIRVDEQKVRQAVLALMENARHHGGEKIGIIVSECNETVTISVRDNGRGISDKVKTFAFERFFRGSNAASKYADGLGLGLPIVRSIAEAHGGKAVILDNHPKGARVEISLPLSQNGG